MEFSGRRTRSEHTPFNFTIYDRDATIETHVFIRGLHKAIVSKIHNKSQHPASRQMKMAARLVLT
jgi:hypothetical protein